MQAHFWVFEETFYILNENNCIIAINIFLLGWVHTQQLRKKEIATRVCLITLKQFVKCAIMK